MVFESEPIVRVLSEIDEEHKAVTSLLAFLSLDQLTERRGDQWSAVDLLIHLTYWQENALKVARQQAAPDAPEVDPTLGAGRLLGIETDAANAEVLDRHRDWTLDQALGWYNRVYADLRAALAVLPSSRLIGGTGPRGARMWYARPALLHSREHRREFEQRLGL